MPKKPKQLKWPEPKTAKELRVVDEWVEQLDAYRTNPDSRGFARMFFTQPHVNAYAVHLLLTRAAKLPRVTREEEIIVAFGPSALAQLIRTYVDPVPILSRDRVEDMIFRIADLLVKNPADVPQYLRRGVLDCEPKGDPAATKALLDRIDTQDPRYFWCGGLRPEDPNASDDY